MRLLLKALLDFLRGFGASIEGVEFLMTHRALWRPLALHFGASAVVMLVASLAVLPLRGVVTPYVQSLTLSWYLSPLEWAWGATPWLLASLLTLLLAEIAYLAAAWPAPVVAAVFAIRRGHGHDHPPMSTIAGGRGRLIFALAVCSASCLVLVWTASVAWIFVAILGMIVTSGAGLLYPGWQPAIGVVPGSFRSYLVRGPLLFGLGTGLFVLWMIPIVGLLSLPVGVVGATCLTLREERGGARS